MRERAWHLWHGLDIEAMQKAAGCLIGQHDFSSFRDSECQAHSPVRMMEAIDIARDGEMITSLRGSMGKQQRDCFKKEEKDRGLVTSILNILP